MLAVKNAHPRDANITFYDYGRYFDIQYNGKVYTIKERDHFYIIKGMNGHPASMTETIKKYFNPFIPDKVIQGMMKSKKWPMSEYFGMTPDQIKAKWKEASELGTQMHLEIELFLNGELKEEPQTKEFQMFKLFWRDLNKTFPKLKPYRTEWLIYDEDGEVAGSVDFAAIDDEGNIWLFDWKRSKSIRMTNDFQNGKGPFAHLDDCNFVHYTLQLNGYRYNIEKNYGHRVKGMFLPVFHPNQDTYKFLQVPDRQAEIKQLWTTLPAPQDLGKFYSITGVRLMVPNEPHIELDPTIHFKPNQLPELIEIEIKRGNKFVCNSQVETSVPMVTIPKVPPIEEMTLIIS